MSFAYIPIPLFNEEHFEQCIVIPFPEGAKIVDVVLVDKTAYLLVEAHPHAHVIQGHFHIVTALQTLYADGHEYVGTVKIENFREQPLAIYTIIRITAGDFGIHSSEYKLAHPDSTVEQNDALPDSDSDVELRKIWDKFDMGRNKTDESTENDDAV